MFYAVVQLIGAKKESENFMYRQVLYWTWCVEHEIFLTDDYDAMFKNFLDASEDFDMDNQKWCFEVGQHVKEKLDWISVQKFS